MHTRLALAGVVIGLCTTASPAAAGMTRLERQQLLAHLEMTAGWLVDEVEHLTPAQLAFRPAPGSWSILEVLDHLVVVGPIYREDLRRALRTPARTPAGRSRDEDILWYGIDRTSRETAIRGENPKGEVRDLHAALAAYRRQHADLVQYIRTTDDDLRAHLVQRQGCDAYQWALLISTHEQRHVLQIREIKKDRNFPEPPNPRAPDPPS